MLKKICWFVLVFSAVTVLSLAGMMGGSGHTVVAETEATGTIQGRVRAEDGGEVGDVSVRASASPGSYTTTTDAAGFYTFTVPVHPDGYELYFSPVAGASFLMAKPWPGRINILDKEVRAGIDITLPVGGILTGNLFHGATQLPMTGSGIQFSTPNRAIYIYLNARRGVLNPELVPVLPGNYQDDYQTQVITITKRVKTTATVFYRDYYSNYIEAVLTVPNMPNVLGIMHADRRLPIVYSTNAGLTWQYLWWPDPSLDFPSLLLSPAFTRRGENDATLRTLLIKRDQIPTDLDRSLLLRSGDSGASWAQIQADPPDCTGNPLEGDDPAATSWGAIQFNNLQVSPLDTRRLYVTGSCWRKTGLRDYPSDVFLYASEDFGVTWQRRMFFPIHHRIIAWTPSLTERNRMFFIYNERYPVDVLADSSNAGQTWVTHTLTLPWLWTIQNFVADGGLTNTLYVNASVYEQTSDSYLGRFAFSSDGGASWVEKPHPCAFRSFRFLAVPGKAKHLLMDCLAEDYRSKDGGMSWQKITTGDMFSWLYTSYAKPGQIYATVNGGLWSSDDMGDTWRPVWNVPGAYKQFFPIAVKL